MNLMTRFAALFAAAMANTRTDAINFEQRRIAAPTPARRKRRKARVEPKIARNYQAQYKNQFSGYFAQQNLKRKAQNAPMVAG